MSRIVIGGGLGGLSAAKYLFNAFPSETIRVLEASSRAGGWIKSTRIDENTIFEQGPRTIRPKGEAAASTLELVEELGLETEIFPINSTHPAAKNRMIYVNGKLNPLPTSFLSLFQTRPPFSKPLISYLYNDIVDNRTGNKNDESIYDFANRRFGKEVADYLISPMICGICAGNAKEISVKFLMERLFQYEKDHGSVIKGVISNLFFGNVSNTDKGISNCKLAKRARREKWSIYSFKNGMEVLPQTLTNYIVTKGVKLYLNADVKKLSLTPQGAKIETSDSSYDAKHVISSIPAHILGNLLEADHPILADHLKHIPTVNVAVVNIKYNSDHIKNKAFGFLTSPIEKLPILGVIYDSCCFPHSGTVLTVMMGGHWFKKYFGTNPTTDYIYSVARKHVEDILGIFEVPANYKVSILNNCIPQYVVGHQDKVKAIEKYLQNYKLPLSICGSSYYGVGINDVIYGAKNTVETLKASEATR